MPSALQGIVFSAYQEPSRRHWQDRHQPGRLQVTRRLAKRQATLATASDEGAHIGTGGFGDGGLLNMPILLGEFIDTCTSVAGDGQSGQE